MHLLKKEDVGVGERIGERDVRVGIAFNVPSVERWVSEGLGEKLGNLIFGGE